VNLYLDDDSVDTLLIRLLRHAGHAVQIPADVGISGDDDSVHLAYAIGADRILLSQNHRDFRNLHNLVMQAKGHHPGILIVRKDNDPTRDLKPAGVVRAIRNLEQAAVPLTDEYHILNHWR
jgi:predicted nuclease of predicted toxin-antitoxin system